MEVPSSERADLQTLARSRRWLELHQLFGELPEHFDLEPPEAGKPVAAMSNTSDQTHPRSSMAKGEGSGSTNSGPALNGNDGVMRTQTRRTGRLVRRPPGRVLDHPRDLRIFKAIVVGVSPQW